MSSFRPMLLLALIASAPAVAGEVTVQDLARRLQALEQRLGQSPPPAATDAIDPAALDQRLRILERKLELQAEADEARTRSTPVVALDREKGLSVKSPESGLEVKFRGLVQGDGRFYLGDSAGAADTLLMRRIEPTVEGSWGPLLGFRMTAQLAGDSASVSDAYVDVKFDPRATLRIGKAKMPIGLERLQSSASTNQVETGLPSELIPNRDIGVQLQGQFKGPGLSYAVGVFNGAVDGRDGATTNPDDDFELAGRVFLEPWKGGDGALSGLGFGIGASSGHTRGSGNAFLPRYRSPGQVQFFGYRGDVAADGERVRWSPQASYYRGRFGLLGEYVVSRQELALPSSGLRATFDHRAWQLSGGVVLTGEAASYRGVLPGHPFTLGEAGWGALELTARYGRLDIDDDVFPLFADPAAAASAARSWGLGLNWYLTDNLKLVANYDHTTFDGGAPGNLDREDEQAFFTRAQFSF
jgi:phosphate-selective porin OprO and OprP